MTAPPNADTIPIWLREVAARFAERDAIANASGRLRFAEVEAESAWLARALLAQGKPAQAEDLYRAIIQDAEAV